MAASYITAQVAPLVANAGNQSSYAQTVTTGGTNTTIGTGPGYATPSGGSTSPTPTTPGTTTYSWAILAFVAACLYFAFQRMK